LQFREGPLSFGKPAKQFQVRKMRLSFRMIMLLAAFGMLLRAETARAATVVALGASQTAGKGVSERQAYPAQLETLLRARGLKVHVINAGISGDTTGGMMARIDRAIPRETRVVILQPGGNDLRKGKPNYTTEVRRRLRAMGIRVVMLPNTMFRGKPRQVDGQHLTPQGYHMLAQQLDGPVADALRR
jgi:acyl-CoA thioesterase I